MQYPHNHTSQWIHLCHNSLQQGQWQANIQFWKWNGKCFHQVVCRWFVPFLKNIFARAIYISGPGIMGMEDTSQSTVPFSSTQVLICAFVTAILKCFPVVHEVTWLTSVTCWCPRSLPRGRTMCSEVFCFIRQTAIYFVRRYKVKHVHFSHSTEGALVCVGPSSCGSSTHRPKPGSRKLRLYVTSSLTDVTMVTIATYRSIIKSSLLL